MPIRHQPRPPANFLPYSIVSEHRPRERHLTIDIAPVDGSINKLRVDLAIPLSLECDAERIAAEKLLEWDGSELFEANLDVKYDVHADLEAETTVLLSKIRGLYKTSALGSAITRDVMDVEQNHEHYIEHLRRLAEHGADVFRRLFVDQKIADSYQGWSYQDQKYAFNAVRSAFQRTQLIQINAPRPLFPWNWLYNSIGKGVPFVGMPDVNRFWGMEHKIGERVDGVTSKSLISRNGIPHIVAAICPAEYPDVNATAHSYFGENSDLKKIQVTQVQDVETLREHLLNFQGDILYFLGHADHYPSMERDEVDQWAERAQIVPSASWVMLQGVKLTAAQLRLSERPITYHKEPVLVFLNGCNTNPLDQWNDKSFVGLLCNDQNSQHKVSCLLTSAPVPRKFAANFGAEVWTRMRQGHSIAEAVLGARKLMWSKHNNVLGFMYSFLGRLETRIVL